MEIDSTVWWLAFSRALKISPKSIQPCSHESTKIT